MLRQPRQLISAGIAILLGVAFVAATFVFSASLNAGMTKLVAGMVGDAKVAVSPSDKVYTPVTPQQADTVSKVPGITRAKKIVQGSATLQVDGQDNRALISSQPDLSSETTLFEGTLAKGDGQVSISKSAADAYHLKLGDKVTLETFDNQTFDETVVGIINAGNDAVTQPLASWVFAPTEQAMAMASTNGYNLVLLYGNGDDTALRDAVQSAQGVSDAQLTVRTGQDEVKAAMKQMTGSTNSIQYVLLSFAAIALFVGIIVIANTFSILVAQRVRQLALLRCVGATRNQVFGMVFGEAALLGLVGSVAGILAGFGLAAALIPLASKGAQIPLAFSISPAAVIVPLVVGVLITLAASISPARKATRVAPLAAMRPELAVGKAKRLGIVRAIIGVLLVAGGAAMLAMGMVRAKPNSGMGGLVIAIGGGLLSFIGVLLVGRGLIPALARLIGTPLAKSSVSGDLAVGNTRRNPGRAAATANALLVGVTLITLLTVGASASQASLDRYLSATYPQDAVVSAVKSVDEQTLTRIKATDGVQDAALVPSTTADVSYGTTNTERKVDGVDNAAAHLTHFPQRYENLDDNTVRTSDTSLHDGETVTIKGTAGTTVQLTAKVSDDYAPTLIVSTTVLNKIDADAPDSAWVQYKAGANVNTVTTDLGKAIGNLGHSSIDSGAQARAQFGQMIDIVLAVAVGLLAVAVAIAVIGVANTLGLSVLERTQEIGLLRALGMTRRQVRAMISWEAVMIAVVAAALGLALGVTYGLIGAKTLLGSITSTPFVAGLPWVRLVIIGLIAVAAGWLASLIPASRANRISPSAALATE
ncbi:FtsX-like permease family protein [Propionibacterium freudenreichii]|uniref:ABC transporter permease n=1 Tax=Propionibacterium freudenreichii TaxID=1744 RepID=UPI000BC2D374|nr:FtsX-like permease family protein [Propionibacterium freudenreichii]MDK9354482.1 FtsX-like permease family protein [Propionibacterium freudenreichii]SCQ64510.1 ABC transporter associated permease [Propionibacterium freudenreichii]SCQ71095.1 ABC transporter associated permease [Propionibacterium freudenreichii]